MEVSTNSAIFAAVDIKNTGDIEKDTLYLVSETGKVLWKKHINEKKE